VVAHAGIERRDPGADDIGRIGQYEIEDAVDARRPVGHDKTGPRRKTERGGIGARDIERRAGNIDAQPLRIRPFGQDRQQQAAGAGAEIEDTGARDAAQKIERGGDQRFAVGARIEHGRRHREVETPEFAAAENARHRLARETALLIPGKKHLFLRRDEGAGLADHLDLARPRRAAHHEPRIEFGRWKAGLFQPPAQHPRRMIARVHASSPSAARRAA